MSSGWAWWVIGLIVFNMGLTFCLFVWAPIARVPTLPDGTTGHVWAHGALREGMHRLPGWWIALSLGMFVTAFAYFLLYPGFGNFKGMLGWTSQGELANAVATNDAVLEPTLQRLAAMSVEQAAADPQAQQLGARLFVDNCAACHGRDGRGNPLLGAPDLTDSDWVYGGTAADITNSIRNGRTGVMPQWKALGDATVKNLTQYVLGLSGQTHDAQMAAAGETVFQTTCVACHGPEGKGNPLIGAPNLTDRASVYGNSAAAIEESIGNGRQGHMPAWSPRLSDSDTHLLAAYVHHLANRSDAAGR